MEGPSLFLAAEQLAPFIKQRLVEVTGNTKIGKERLNNQRVLNIFAWGKHLVFQFKEFALRVHFLLFGSFQASIKGNKVTGDYPKKNREPRLQMTFKNGVIEMYSCSLKFIEDADVKSHYDYTIDIMSSEWDSKQAVKKIREHPNSEIGDLLLDQSHFSGVGNIIKNEVMFLVGRKPDTLIQNLSLAEIKAIVTTTKQFALQFYEWRKLFELRKHYQIYKKKICKVCHEKVFKGITGRQKRVSYVCLHCQH